MNTEKACRFCKEQKEDLAIHSRTPKKIYYSCRSCNRERARKYRKTPSGKASVKRSTRKYDNNNPKKKRAWEAAKKLGERKNCEMCGTDKFIHMHHPNYDEPENVIFLCAKHHKQVHREMELSTE